MLGPALAARQHMPALACCAPPDPGMPGLPGAWRRPGTAGRTVSVWHDHDARPEDAVPRGWGPAVLPRRGPCADPGASPTAPPCLPVAHGHLR